MKAFFLYAFVYFLIFNKSLIFADPPVNQYYDFLRLRGDFKIKNSNLYWFNSELKEYILVEQNITNINENLTCLLDFNKTNIIAWDPYPQREFNRKNGLLLIVKTNRYFDSNENVNLLKISYIIREANQNKNLLTFDFFPSKIYDGGLGLSFDILDKRLILLYKIYYDGSEGFPTFIIIDREKNFNYNIDGAMLVKVYKYFDFYIFIAGPAGAAGWADVVTEHSIVFFYNSTYGCVIKMPLDEMGTDFAPLPQVSKILEANDKLFFCTSRGVVALNLFDFSGYFLKIERNVVFKKRTPYYYTHLSEPSGFFKTGASSEIFAKIPTTDFKNNKLILKIPTNLVGICIGDNLSITNIKNKKQVFFPSYSDIKIYDALTKTNIIYSKFYSMDYTIYFPFISNYRETNFILIDKGFVLLSNNIKLSYKKVDFDLLLNYKKKAICIGDNVNIRDFSEYYPALEIKQYDKKRVISQLNKGDMVYILKEEKDWYEVFWLDKKIRGWVNKSYLEDYKENTNKDTFISNDRD